MKYFELQIYTVLGRITHNFVNFKNWDSGMQSS